MFGGSVKLNLWAFSPFELITDCLATSLIRAFHYFLSSQVKIDMDVLFHFTFRFCPLIPDSSDTLLSNHLYHLQPLLLSSTKVLLKLLFFVEVFCVQDVQLHVLNFYAFGLLILFVCIHIHLFIHR